MMQSLSVEWWRASAPAGRRTFAAAHGVEAGGRRGAYLALAVFTVVLLAAPQEWVHALEPLHLALIAGGWAIAVHVLDRVQGRTRPARSREVWLTLGIVAWAAATLPLSIWPGGSVAELRDVYLKSAAIFWLLAGVIDTRWRLRTLFWMLALLTVPLAVVGLHNFAAGTLDAGRVQGYDSGMAGNPNDLALTLDILVPLIVSLAVTARRVSARIAAVALLSLCVAAIVVTFSRGGFLGLTAIALLYAIYFARRGRLAPVAALVVAGLLALPLMPAGYATRLSTIGNIAADPTGSAQARWHDMTLAARYVAAHPMGQGIGTDALALNALRGNLWREVHDTYLVYGMDLGWPGLALFLALVVCAVGTARRAERIGSGDLSVLSTGIRISLIGFAAAALVYPEAYYFYFYYPAGLAVAALRIARRDRL